MTTLKKIYLNITLNNLIAIYNRKENDNVEEKETEIIQIKEFRGQEFLDNIEKFKTAFKEKKNEFELENPFFKKQLNTNMENYEQINFSNINKFNQYYKPDSTNQQLNKPLNIKPTNIFERDLSLNIIESKLTNDNLKSSLNETCFNTSLKGQLNKPGLNLNESKNSLDNPDFLNMPKFKFKNVEKNQSNDKLKFDNNDFFCSTQKELQDNNLEGFEHSFLDEF